MVQVRTFECPSGAARLHGRERGEGPPVVCLHAGVADGRMFDAEHAMLGDIARVISYDRRGFGQTVTQDEPFSHVADLRALYDVCAVDVAVLVGCSQGGRVAVDFALENPDRVRGLFLVATAVSGAPAPEFPDDIAEVVDALDAADDRGDIDLMNELEAHLWLDGPRSERGRVCGPTRELFLEMNGRALRHAPLTKEFDPPDAWDRLENLECPTRVVWGTLDFPHVRERQELLVERLAQSTGRELASVAHLPGLEVPDVINAEIRTFLNALGG